MADPRIVRCTPAQIRVLGELVLDGADNRDIASRLCVTVDTVKSHLKSVYALTGIRSRTSLALDIERGDLVVRDQANRVHEF